MHMARGGAAKRVRKKPAPETITLPVREFPPFPPPRPEFPEPRLFSVEDVFRMYEAGVVHPDEKLELRDGVLIRMAAQGTPHIMCVTRLTRWLCRGVDDGIVLVQSTVRLGEWSLPEPDIAVVADLDYEGRGRHAEGRDILLAIEVGDTNTRKDKREKLPRYAREGVREVWWVDLPKQLVKVHRSPRRKAGEFARVRELRRGETLSPSLLPGLSISVDEVLGPHLR